MEERIEGFDIPYRVLTDEEAAMDITLERINEFHYLVGEDFLDTVESLNNQKIALQMCGFAMAKHPEMAFEMLKVCNESKMLYTQKILDVYREYDENDDLFYVDFCEFLNFTVHSKKRANQVLIQVKEKYEN